MILHALGWALLGMACLFWLGYCVDEILDGNVMPSLITSALVGLALVLSCNGNSPTPPNKETPIWPVSSPSPTVNIVTPIVERRSPAITSPVSVASSTPTPNVRTAPPITPTATQAVNDAHRLLIVLVEFADWKFPMDMNTVEAQVKQAVDSWNKIYGDKGDFTSDVVPVILAENRPTDFAFRNGVVAMVKAGGHHGDIDFVLGPQIQGQRSNSGYIVLPISFLGGVLNHETGHRLGLDHTSALVAARPFDPDRAVAGFTDQAEYGDFDFMGGGNGPPPFGDLSCYHRSKLRLPYKATITKRDQRWTYWRCTDNGKLLIVGPYRGKWGAGPRSYYLPEKPGTRLVDVNGVKP